ncbi:MAG: bacteriocin [Syntrophomonas sp.]
MSEKNKKYQKPVLNGLGDRKGKLSDKELAQVTGGGCQSGTSAHSACSSGTQVVPCIGGGFVRIADIPPCWEGSGNIFECFSGSGACSGYKPNGGGVIRPPL